MQSTNRLAKRLRLLTQYLLLSGALNVGLLVALVYTSQKDSFTEEAPLVLKESPLPSSEESIHLFAKLAQAELVEHLKDNTALEEGYKKRDMALACLVKFHYFDVERALGRVPGFREMPLGEGKIKLFPALKEEDFALIEKFIEIERFPKTAEGLFIEIQKEESAELVDAFCHTKEYERLENLIGKRDQKQIISLIKSASFEQLRPFIEVEDFSPQKRRAFLEGYLTQPIAAVWLIENEEEWKRFSDEQVLSILNLLDRQSALTLSFAKAVAFSKRSDLVVQKARTFLPLQQAPKIVQVVNSPVKKIVKPTKKGKIHIVLPGESLWKISKNYGVPVDKIIEANFLENEKLKPGDKLRIPN